MHFRHENQGEFKEKQNKAPVILLVDDVNVRIDFCKCGLETNHKGAIFTTVCHDPFIETYWTVEANIDNFRSPRRSHCSKQWCLVGWE